MSRLGKIREGLQRANCPPQGLGLRLHFLKAVNLIGGRLPARAPNTADTNRNVTLPAPPPPTPPSRRGGTRGARRWPCRAARGAPPEVTPSLPRPERRASCRPKRRGPAPRVREIQPSYLSRPGQAMRVPSLPHRILANQRDQMVGRCGVSGNELDKVHKPRWCWISSTTCSARKPPWRATTCPWQRSALKKPCDATVGASPPCSNWAECSATCTPLQR